MKKISIVILVLVSATTYAQEFDKNIATARTSYAAGNLQDSRFAMEQMLRDLDAAIGQEILKLLPTTLMGAAATTQDDNVTGTGGYVGLYVERSYGSPEKGSIQIINNSPLITSINAILTMPVLGGMMRDENQKVVRIQGYKSLLNKTVDAEAGKTDYELQIPMNNTLVTMRFSNTTEGEITAAANGLALAKIVQIAQ